MKVKARKLKVKWTSRNVDRIHKWLNIESNWSGFFKRNGNVVGHKTATSDCRYLIFWFYAN